MTSHTNLLLWKRSPAALMLCGVALMALCSCAPQMQSPSPVKMVSTTTPPRVTVKPPPTTIQAGSVIAPHVSAHDLPNFHVVTPMLLRGAAPTPEGLVSLQKMGVKTVIDLRIAPKTVAKEHAQLDKMGVHFINLPMSGEPPTEKQIQTFLKTIADPAQQPVFVHCQHGADRTGTMLGIYRETVDGWSYDQTYKEMRKFGFNAHWSKLSTTVRRFAPATPAH